MVIDSLFFCLFPCLFEDKLSDAGLMDNEFAPSLLKLLFIEKRIASMAVKIPTKQAMPIAIINKVSKDLTKFDLME